MKFIFRTTDLVSCISGSKSPQPEKRNKGITPNISLNGMRLNAVNSLMFFNLIETTSFKNVTILLKKYVILPVRMFLIVENNI